MSGLALFFRERFDDVDDDNSGIVNDAIETGSAGYSRSLWTLVTKAKTTTAATLTERNQHENEEEYKYDEPLTLQSWRTYQKTALSEFFTRRLLEPNAPELDDTAVHADGNDDENNDDDDNVLDDTIQRSASSSTRAAVTSSRNDAAKKHATNDEVEDEDETAFLETQQDFLLDDEQCRPIVSTTSVRRDVLNHDAVADASEAKEGTHFRLRQPRMFRLPLNIPHDTETSGDITNIAEIDLYAHTVSLSLCRVDLYWPQRDVRRMKNFPYDLKHYQHDGPVSVLYNPMRKSRATSPTGGVITLEIQQISCLQPDDGISELRRRAQQLHSRSFRCSTIILFLYGAYADKVHQLLDQVHQHQKKRSMTTVQLYMRLRNIPARCVLPLDATDWYDTGKANCSPYCLCIGDETSMQVNDDNNQDHEYVRLDDSELGIDCLIVCDQTDDDETQGCGIILARYELVSDETKGACLRSVALVSDNDENDRANTINGQTIEALYRQYMRAQKGKNMESTKQNTMSTTLSGEIVVDNRPDEVVDKVTETNHSFSKQLSVRASQADARVDTDSCTVSRTTTLPVSKSTHPSLHAQKRRRVDAGKYETLSSLPSLLSETALLSAVGAETSCIVSLYAAVVSFTQPCRTKRGDWMMSIVLVDDSLESSGEPDQGGASLSSTHRTVNINIFVPHKHRDKLPSVRYAGDGIRLNNIKVNQWNGDIQLAGMANIGSSFVVFRGVVNDPEATKELSFYPTDEENFGLTPQNKAYMLDMWRRTQQRFMVCSIMKKEHRIRLSDLSLHSLSVNAESLTGDLTVMITAIIPIPDRDLTGVSPRGFLRVWDGTGPSKSDPLPLDSVGALEAIRDGDPPSAALIAIASIIKQLQSTRQTPTFQPPVAVCGRVTNVVVWERQHWDLIKNKVVGVGSFMRLRNVDERNLANSDLTSLNVHEKSSFTPLTNLNYEVTQLLEEHNSRLLRTELTNPSSGLLPLDHDPRTENSLHEDCSLQAFISAPSGAMFKGILYISGLIPCLTNQSTREEWAQICQSKFTNDEPRRFRFGLCLHAAKSATTIDALILDDSPVKGRLIGEHLFGMAVEEAMAARLEALNNFQSHVQTKHFWYVGMRSFACGGKKFFVIHSFKKL